MTKTQVDKLQYNVDVLKTDNAVIKVELDAVKDNIKEIKGLVKWFIGIGLAILIAIVGDIWVNAGDKKQIKSMLEHNSKVIGDMAAQGVDYGWYKPNKETYRTGEKIKLDK